MNPNDLSSNLFSSPVPTPFLVGYFYFLPQLAVPFPQLWYRILLVVDISLIANLIISAYQFIMYFNCIITVLTYTFCCYAKVSISMICTKNSTQVLFR